MPAVRIINPPQLAPAVGYAHAATAHGFVWLGGQISTDQGGTVLFPGDIAAQFGQALRNLEVALRAAGCTPDGVVKLTYYVTDLSAYRAALKPIGAAYRQVFGRHYPAATLVEVKSLFQPEALVELECVAAQEAETHPRPRSAGLGVQE